MVSAVDNIALAQTIHANLGRVISDPTTSAGDVENYTDLLNSFLTSDSLVTDDYTFADIIRIGAEEAGVDASLVERQIATAQTAGPGQHADFAEHIISQMASDSMPMILDLTDGYAPSADFSINNLRELQASEYSMPLVAFEEQFANLDGFDEFFENVNDSNGWLSNDPLYNEIGPALNDNPEALETLIAASSNPDAMQALVEASATEAGRESFDHVLQEVNAILDASEPAAPEQGGQEYLADAGLNSTGTATLASEAAAAFAEAAAAEEAVMEQPVVPEAEPIDPSTLSREDIISGLHDMQQSGNEWQLESYQQGLVLLNPDYQQFFDGLDSQAGALGINPAADLLEGALNNPESGVLETMISYADDPASLQAMTAMVTDDGSDFHFIADERQMTQFINSLARENGLDVHTDENGMTTVPEGGFSADGPVVAEGVDTFEGTVENQLDIMVNAPEVVVPEGTELPDNIPPSRITEVTPEGTVIPPTPDAIPRPEELFQAPANEDDTSPPTIVEPFAGAVAQGAVVDSVYPVVAGDNLWNIAQDYYELDNAGDIMRAVDHIARMNGLENGTDANHIDVGDELNMPSAEQITQDVESLDWNALDNDPTIGAANSFPDRAAAAPNTLG